MTQPPSRPRQASGDEGAGQTAQIVAAVKALRKARDWSAQRLADEMVKVGVPWNRDIVVNLERGRRKSLRVHELLALLFIMDADRPLDVIVPGDELFPVVPGLLVKPEDIRAWLRGEGRPLRHTIADGTASPSALESAAQLFEQQGQPDMAAGMRRMARLMDVAVDGASGNGS